MRKMDKKMYYVIYIYYFIMLYDCDIYYGYFSYDSILILNITIFMIFIIKIFK